MSVKLPPPPPAPRPAVMDGGFSDPVWQRWFSQTLVAAFLESGTGSSLYVNIMDYAGADNTGVTDSTGAAVLALADAGDGGVIFFPPGGSYKLIDFDVSGKAITLLMDGATIICGTAGHGAIKKTDHGKKLNLRGGKFTGPGIGVNWITGTSGTEYDEFLFIGTTFQNADYGIYLDGVREGVLMGCSFDGVAANKGAYRVRTVNTQFIGCFWKNTAYMVNDDGDYSPYSAGLVINGGVAIGCTVGVRSQGTDLVSITGGCVIDYCDSPVYLLGVDGVEINGGCYITSRTVNPAIYINLGSNGDTTKNVKITNNTILTHSLAVNADAMQVFHVASGFISHNTISFFQQFGINFAACAALTISENTLAPAPGGPSTTAIAETATGDSSNRITRNDTDGLLIAVLFAQLEWNKGFKTEASGQVFIGGGIGTIAVTHGLSYTPTESDIQLTPTSAQAAIGQPFIDGVTATTFQVTYVTPQAAVTAVSWMIRKHLF